MEHKLNDTEQVRVDAINLVDDLTEYNDSGDNEQANELFRDFIHHLIINGFIVAYLDITNYNSNISGLGDNKLYTIHPALFTYFLIKYCFAGNPHIHEQVDLDFPEWKFTMDVLMKYFM